MSIHESTKLFISTLKSKIPQGEISGLLILSVALPIITFIYIASDKDNFRPGRYELIVGIVYFGIPFYCFRLMYFIFSSYFDLRKAMNKQNHREEA